MPPQSKKTILDAVDGCYARTLNEESQPLTAFITEEGWFKYLRLLQGYLAAGDVYTRRYDEIIKDIPRKIKIEDGTLVYNNNIKNTFHPMWDYLFQHAQIGIFINKKKCKFCRDTKEFAGLKLTPNSIAPSDTILLAIKDFPKPADFNKCLIHTYACMLYIYIYIYIYICNIAAVKVCLKK